jgi:hypothetical protein
MNQCRYRDLTGNTRQDTWFLVLEIILYLRSSQLLFLTPSTLSTCANWLLSTQALIVGFIYAQYCQLQRLTIDCGHRYNQHSGCQFIGSTVSTVLLMTQWTQIHGFDHTLIIGIHLLKGALHYLRVRTPDHVYSHCCRSICRYKLSSRHAIAVR